MTTPVKIAKRKAYKAADVCSMVELQPYVLRTWEAEFPDLGVPQSKGRTRLYRQADVDKVIRIKELIVGDGLTLGAARRKLLQETPDSDESDLVLFDTDGGEVRAQVEVVKSGLRSLLEMLSEPGNGGAAEGGPKSAQAVAAVVSPADSVPEKKSRKPSRRTKSAQERA
jgi:DNA-binding transcriptional MerR regulator